MAELDLNAIKARDYRPDRNGAAAYRQSDLAAVDVPALVAEVERLRAELGSETERAASWQVACEAAARDGDQLRKALKEACDQVAERESEVGHWSAETAEHKADRDRAREIAVALEQEVARLRALPEAWTRAAAEQQSIARGEVPELPRDLALVARGRARQLEDCAAELVAALNTEVTG